MLITGESGTGKELIARAIHHNSLRKDKPFVAVDCNALSENLLESELFGHVKGAFTGAVAHKKGMFEMAEGGTLFLDEIGNIPLSIQAKLLRVIQEREYRAVGDTRTQSANFRLIAATNKDLAGDGRPPATFRDDLYYRINVFPIAAPALRDRREDIPALAFHFVRAFSRELGKDVDEISEGALNLLASYDWPGNVRELENALHRATILATDHVLRKAHLVAILEARPDLGADVPTTGEELKRLKKAAREKQRRGHRAAVRARGAQAQRLERHAERRGHRDAALQFPGADEEAQHPGARFGSRCGRCAAAGSGRAPDRRRMPPARATELRIR